LAVNVKFVVVPAGRPGTLGVRLVDAFGIAIAGEPVHR
jgi:hypothetical protein